MKAVLFDLGGTLVKISNTDIPHVMRRILKHCGINRSLEEISQAWIEAEKALDFRDSARLLDEFWVQLNIRILNNLKIVYSDRRIHCNSLVELFQRKPLSRRRKDTPPTETEDIKTGLVTNGLQSDIDNIQL